MKAWTGAVEADKTEINTRRKVLIVETLSAFLSVDRLREVRVWKRSDAGNVRTCHGGNLIVSKL
jgi:hypothetical protein